MKTALTLILFQFIVKGASPDSAIMLEFALSLHVNIKEPVLWNEIQSDYCNAQGVGCTAGGEVWQVDWENMGLYGILNVTSFPPALTYLDLTGNDLTGGVPVLPSGFGGFFVEGNLLSGYIPVFPSSMYGISLRRNKLIGDISVIPKDAIHVWLAENAFWGSLTLNRPNKLLIDDTWITDLIISDPSDLIECDMSNTPLLGNPHIVNLTMCTSNGLYDANLLPNTLTSRQQSRQQSSAHLTNLQYTSTNLISSSFLTTPIHVLTNLRATTILAVSSSMTLPSHTFFQTALSTTVQLVYFLSMSTNPTLYSVIKIAARLVVDLIILILILERTPFKREFKRLFVPIKATKDTNTKYTL